MDRDIEAAADLAEPVYRDDGDRDRRALTPPRWFGERVLDKDGETDPENGTDD